METFVLGRGRILEMRAVVCCCMGGVLRRTPGPLFLPLQPVAPFLPLPTPRLSSPSAWFSWAGVPVPGCHPVVFAPGVSIVQPGSFPTGNRGSRGRIGTSGPSRIRPRLTSRRPVSRPTSARVSPLPVVSAFRFPTRLRPPTSAGSGRCCLRGRDAVGSVLPSCRSPFGAVPGIRSGFPPGGAVGHRDPTSTPVPDPGFAPPTRQVVDGSGPACDREARLFASLRPEPVIPRDPSYHVSVRPRDPPGK